MDDGAGRSRSTVGWEIVSFSLEKKSRPEGRLDFIQRGSLEEILRDRQRILSNNFRPDP